MNGREDFDNVAWDRNDEAWEKSRKRLRQTSICRLVESLVEQKFNKRTTLVSIPLIIGGYNILYRVRLDGVSPNVIVRLPCPHLAQFPDEKTLREAATARYIGRNTQFPNYSIMVKILTLAPLSSYNMSKTGGPCPTR
jgi:hypothetical protein